eukprot:767222-Hanusia_phi.AAC.1
MEVDRLRGQVQQHLGQVVMMWKRCWFVDEKGRFYKQQPWPHPTEQVAPLVENDDVFVMLYKELYFRHMYARLGQAISIEQRIESWENYILLFDRIFSDEDDMQSIDLPVQ